MIAAVVPLLLESLVLFVRPQWLTALAFHALREHRFTLRSRRRVIDPGAGYRDPAHGEAPIPELPRRTELSDSVLFADGPRLALRRAYGLGRRQIWLVGITIERTGDEIVLRAKQALVPMSLLLFVLVFALGAYQRTGHWVAFALFAGVGPFLVLIVWGLQHLFTRGSRDAQLDEAFSFVEDELRRHLEEPPGPRTS
jgi:hypothetical protein